MVTTVFVSVAKLTFGEGLGLSLEPTDGSGAWSIFGDGEGVVFELGLPVGVAIGLLLGLPVGEAEGLELGLPDGEGDGFTAYGRDAVGLKTAES